MTTYVLIFINSIFGIRKISNCLMFWLYWCIVRNSFSSMHRDLCMHNIIYFSTIHIIIFEWLYAVCIYVLFSSYFTHISCHVTTYFSWRIYWSSHCILFLSQSRHHLNYFPFLIVGGSISEFSIFTLRLQFITTPSQFVKI